MSGAHPAERQNAAVYALLAVLVLMSVGPIVLMLLTSLRLKVDIFSDTASLLFMPTLRNYETVLATSCGTSRRTSITAIRPSGGPWATPW